MKCLPIVIVVLTALGSVVAIARPWELVLRVDPLDDVCQLVDFRSAQINKDLLTQVVIKEATPVPHPSTATQDTVLRVTSYDVHALLSQAQLDCSNDLSALLPGRGHPSTQVPLLVQGANARISEVHVPPLEVIPLITSGPAENRVDLAFFADGYTTDERDKFIEDALRLAQDVTTNDAFFSVKPLLNFWAVFPPSKESGVGVGGKAKDTPFGLYRDGTELRGVYANNSDVALAACATLGDMCDYPILLGNDPLYGGLGGSYTTTTASTANGVTVLRHEIGHSIIQIGEEYDGGVAYFGVNAIHDSQQVSWAHWLTDKDHPRVERSVMPMQSYPWTLLEVGKPWSVTFESSGTYDRYLIKFSLSGVPLADDLVVYLDGRDLEWTPEPDIGLDRWHYSVFSEQPLTVGEHVLEFALRNNKIQGQAQLCSVEALEYGTPEEFNTTQGYYGVFPTHDINNATTYRPTDEGCLMRKMTHTSFCNVCLEGLWLSLLKRVDLIDDLRVTCSGSSSREVQLDLVKLAQFREHPLGGAESYTVKWTRNGQVLGALTNHTTVELNDTLAEGQYRVDVTYAVDEVRLDPRGYLHASRIFDMSSYAC